MNDMNASFLSYARKILGVIALSMAAGTQVLETFFGYQGCFLCHVERGILFLAGILALYNFKSWWSGLAWISGCAVTLYHIGVQQKWLSVASFCRVYSPHGDTVDAQMQDFLSHASISCDQVTLRIFGISAVIFLYLFFLLGAAVFFLWKYRNR
jgi:disulfide bond formation protein DsbB